MARKSKPFVFLLISALSLAIALALEWLFRGNLGQWTSVAAGWLAALLILIIFHLFLLVRTRNTADGPAAMRALALIGIRLFALIIPILVVLVSGFFGAAPFVVGLCAAYFCWSWMEIALLKAAPF